MGQLTESIYRISPPSKMVMSFIACVIFLNVCSQYSHLGRALAILSLFMLVFLVFIPLSDGPLNGLQARFPRFSPDGAPVTGIIILGGVLSCVGRPDSIRWTPTGAVARLFETAKLAEDFPDARILVSAGPTYVESGVSEAEGIGRYLVAMGVDAERLVLEHRSRDTFENALFSYALVSPKPDERWLLVTSAYHMPRAVGCFRKIGFNVVAAPTDCQILHGRARRSVTRNLDRLDLVTREYLGLFVYWILGRTTSFMAAP